MSIETRRALPTDCETIAEFNQLLAWETEDKSLDGEVLRCGVAALLADTHKGVYYLAESAGQVVGQAMITREWSDWRNGWMWWLQSVYVRAESRRCGVFSALFEQILNEARADGSVIGLRLYVEQGNHTAQAVYRRYGLEEIPYQIFQRWPLDLVES